MTETNEQRQDRLRPILDQLKASKNSAFLDLCELVLMYAAEVDGSIKWDHPRVVLHIRQRLTATRIAKRRGVELDMRQK
jgi:hypothetical protein